MVRRKSFLVSALVCLISIAASPARADDTDLYSNRKCSSFLTPDGQPDTEQFPTLKLWLQGYLNGIGAASRHDLPSGNTEVSKFAAMMLMMCTKEPSKPMIDEAVATAEFMLNTLNPTSKKAIKLRIPGNSQ
jgi:hypothetical protein